VTEERRRRVTGDTTRFGKSRHSGKKKKGKDERRRAGRFTGRGGKETLPLDASDKKKKRLRGRKASDHRRQEGRKKDLLVES